MTTLSRILARAGLGKAGSRGERAPAQPAEPLPSAAELVESLPEVVFLADLNGTWTFLNPSWERLTGFPLGESIGTSFLDYIHPQHQEQWIEFFHRIKSGVAADRPLAVRCLRKDGGYRWIDIHASALRDSAGSLRGVAGTLTDITEHMREEELQRANTRTLEALIGNLPGMVYRGRNNEDWTMEYVSSGSFELTGYRPSDLINSKTLPFGSLMHPDDRQRVWNEVQCALREDRPFELKYRIVTADNSVKWVWERGKGNFASTGELLSLEGFIVDITLSKRTEDRLQQALLYDPLTQQPNPTLFMDRLQVALRKAEGDPDFSFALLLLHLDRFLAFQHKYGQAAGDIVAAEISRRLSEAFDVNATISRIRDERFGIILETVRDIKDVNKAAQKIQELVILPIVVGESEIYSTSSIGIALSSSGYRQIDDMMADADTALSRAKALGGARYEVFDLRINARAAAHAQMQSELEQGIRDGQLHVHWQPIVTASDGRITGLEAKLAWQHPRKGVLYAEDFVAAAKDNQFVLPLWDLMLAEVCRQMSLWKGSGAAVPALTIYISGNTLLDADSILRLGQQLLAAKPLPFQLALGIPEYVLTETPRAIQGMLARIKARNIRLVLDDFGAGTSALSLLRMMPVSTLRLHPALSKAEIDEHRNFVAGIVELAHCLEMAVIGSGVTSEEELVRLRDSGYDYVQGNFISPPVGETAVAAMLEQDQRRWA